MLGALYAVLAAACFGFNNASARRGVLSGTALQGLAISMPLGILLFVIGASVLGEWQQFSRLSARGIALLSAAGFMHFVWGRYFNIRSLAAVGSNIAGPVQQAQLLLALALAIVFLGETLTPLKVVGIVLITSAPAYILRRRARSKAGDGPATAPEFKPRMVEGYVCALLTALGFGSSSVLVRAGLDGTGLSFLGGFISYAAAVALVALIMFVPGRFREVRGMTRVSAKWFVFSGVSVSMSQMFRYLALGVAPVTIVQPLQSLSLMFRMIFGYFINREHERFERYIIVGIAVSLVGALALTVSSEFVLRHVDLPGWLAGLASWTWP